MAFAAACGGSDGEDAASVGGKSMVTQAGQRIRVFKLLEEPAADATRGKFIGLSGQICNARRRGVLPNSRFTLEVDHKRLVNPEPQLQWGAGPADLSAKSGLVPPGNCIDGWDAYGLPATAQVTAVVFVPDTDHPRANRVRFRLPDRRTPPPTQFPREPTSVPATSTTPTSSRIEGAIGQTLTTSRGNRVVIHAFELPVPSLPSAAGPGREFAAIDAELCQDQPPVPGGTQASSGFELVMPDNTRAAAAAAVRKPELPLIATLGQGDCLRGWVTFEVPSGVRPKEAIFRTEPPLHWNL
jgi:hypothetical protein